MGGGKVWAGLAGRLFGPGGRGWAGSPWWKPGKGEAEAGLGQPQGKPACADTPRLRCSGTKAARERVLAAPP